MRAPSLLFVCASGALIEAISTFAFADDSPPWPPAVAASGSCPDSSAVQTLLAGLLPTSPPAGLPATASVSDLGESYVVAVDDRAKTYSDASRDCAERARVAAAFISLALVPPPPLPDAPPPAPKAVPPPQQEPLAPPRREQQRSPPLALWARIDVRGTYTDAPANGLLAPGVAIGFAAGAGRIGGQAVCGWVSGASMSVAGETGTIVIERFPCALGPVVKLSPATAPLEVNASADAVLGALRAAGTGFASSYDSTRLEVGARLAVDATMHFGRRPGDLAPVLGLEATYDPTSYSLAVVPHGVIGSTPSFWVGVNAGVSWSIP